MNVFPSVAAKMSNDAGVLFNLPVTEAWLDQLILPLTLICRSSCRGVKELLRDLFDVSVSIGTIHSRLQCAAEQAVQLAKDVKTLVRWSSHDILALAGPDLAARTALFDFIVAELRQREHLALLRIRPVRRALENQRDDLLAFAGVLDTKLADIAQSCKVPLDLVRDACLLQRKSPLSSAYWQRWNQLHKKLASKFHSVVSAVVDAMKHIPRASSLVENLNSRPPAFLLEPPDLPSQPPS